MPSTLNTDDWSLKPHEACAPHNSFELPWTTFSGKHTCKLGHNLVRMSAGHQHPHGTFSLNGSDTPPSGFADGVTRAPMSAAVSSGIEVRQRHSLVKDPMCLDRPTTYGGVLECTRQALARGPRGALFKLPGTSLAALSLEPCAAPPEAVSTASPSSPQLLEQEERPSNRRAKETCAIQTLQHAVSALRSTEFSPVDSVPIKFRASGFFTILRTTIPWGFPGHRPSWLCQLAKPILAKPTLGIFPHVGQLWATDFGRTNFGQTLCFSVLASLPSVT